jgi:aryl-alcohol dehydrogenase-like predicted oxidoreductase
VTAKPARGLPPGTNGSTYSIVEPPDGVTPIAQTLETLGELIAEGVIRFAACSNFTAGQLLEALDATKADRAGLVALQNEYNLLNRAADDTVLPLCREHGFGFVPYRPLAQGLLTGKYRRGQPVPEGTRLQARQEVIREDDLERIEGLAAWPTQRGHTLLELAIAGLASQSQIASVIAGA